MYPQALGPSTLRELEAVLDAQEKRRARFVFERDRRAFVAAHGALRFALSRFAAVAPQAWEFVANAAGNAPCAVADGSSALAFSLSHSRSLIACAVARAGRVGIDVEQAGAEEPEAPLLAAACVPDEVAHIRAQPTAATRAFAFCRLWTLKEAAAKALGLADDFDPQQLAFTPDGELCAGGRVSREQSQTLVCTSLFPGDGHVVSVARAAADGVPEKLTVCVVGEGAVTFGLTARDT